MDKSVVVRIRRKLAGLMLGDQAALFMPKTLGHVLSSGAYEDLTDEQLGMATRYWFDVIRRNTAELASERHIPITVFSTSQASMSLIRYAIDANADDLTICQDGGIAGRKTGNWRVQVSKLPDDYEFGPPGVQERIEDDNGNVTRLAFGYSFAPPPQPAAPNPSEDV